MFEEFKNYLIEQGYSESTPSGKPSTVSDYINRVSKISERESASVPNLAKDISFYVEKYGPTGKESEFGKKSHNSYISALKQFENFLSEMARIKEEKRKKKEKRVKQFMKSGFSRSEALYWFYKENPAHDRNKYDNSPRYMPNTSVERMKEMEIEEYMKKYEMTRKEAIELQNKEENDAANESERRKKELIESGMTEREAEGAEFMEKLGIPLEEQKKHKTNRNSGCMVALLIMIATTILLSLLIF